MKFEQLVNKIMFKDIVKLSRVHQTFVAEACHSIGNYLAPKMYSYTLTGIN